MKQKTIYIVLIALLLVTCQQKEGNKGVVFHFTPNTVQMDASAGSCDISVQYDGEPRSIRLTELTSGNETIYFPSSEDIVENYKITPKEILYPSSEYGTPVTVEWEWLTIIIEPGGDTFRVITQENKTGEKRSAILEWVDWCSICDKTIEIAQAGAIDEL
ncbi:MAG: hypothetical protein K5651_04455 [Bacteroidales bacterium]|nr:hypothetical protein [Bacteroidales bacterium]